MWTLACVAVVWIVTFTLAPGQAVAAASIWTNSPRRSREKHTTAVSVSEKAAPTGFRLDEIRAVIKRGIR